jgi:WD40 repeat protein
VKFTRDRSFDLGGGAIPTRVILEQFPQLRGLQQVFHEGDCRWSDLLETGLIEFQDLLTRIETGKATDADVQRLRGMLVSGTSQVLQLGKYNINIGQGQNVQIGDRTYVEMTDEAVQAIVAAIQKASKNDRNVLREIFQPTNLSPLINFYKGFRSEFSHLLRNTFFLTSMTSLGLFAVTLLIGTATAKQYIMSPFSENTDTSSLEKVEQAIRAGRRFQKLRLIASFSNLESHIEEQLQKSLMEFTDFPSLDGSEGIGASSAAPSIESLDVSEDGNIIISNSLGYINYWEIKDNQQGSNNRWINKGSSISFINGDRNLEVDAISFSLDDSNTLISLTENLNREEKRINFYDLEKQHQERFCPVDNYEPPIIALDKFDEVLGIIKSQENHEILILSTRDCESYPISAQSGHLEDIEFWPRQNFEDPMILASASSEALMFWNATPPWENSNEPLEIAITWKEDSSITKSLDRIEIPDISKLSFSRDGKFLVTVNQEPNKVYMIRLWEIYVIGPQTNPSVEIKEVDGFSPSNKIIISIDMDDINNQGLLALGDKDGNLQLRSLQDRNHPDTFIEVRGKSDTENSVKVLEFYPEGGVLISGGWDNRINLLDLSILSSSFDELLNKGCAVLQGEVNQDTYDEICPP